MPRSVTEYVQVIVDCGLMSAAEIESICQRLPPEKRPQSPQELARELVQAGRLTRFQANETYKGRGRELSIGNYLILDQIGAGGMGQVYRARHQRMDRVVALKVLSPDSLSSPDAVERFLREAKAAARVSHPNIVTAHDADEARGVHFLVMEYIDGLDLSTLVKRDGPLAIDEVLRAMIEAARGLEHAHQAGIVHRDIKPSNLLRDKSGTVKILDLGLARLETGDAVDDAAETPKNDELTQAGQIMGTVDYMAPEQAIDTRTADARADIYSLGCTLFYLLTGKPPYGGETRVARLVAHHKLPIPSVRAARPEVSEELEQVVKRMLAKNPDARYQTMGDVINALESCLAPKPAVQPAAKASLPTGKPLSHAKAKSAPQQPTDSRQSKQLWWYVGGGIAAMIVAVVVAIGMTSGGSQEDAPQPTVAMTTPNAPQSSKAPEVKPAQTPAASKPKDSNQLDPLPTSAGLEPKQKPKTDAPPATDPPSAKPPVTDVAAASSTPKLPVEPPPTSPVKPTTPVAKPEPPKSTAPPKTPMPTPPPKSPTPSRMPTDLGPPIDLLSRVSLYRDAAVGPWEQGAGGMLRCDAEKEYRASRLQLPVQVPAQYVISADVTAISSSSTGGSFYLGIVAGGRQVTINFRDNAPPWINVLANKENKDYMVPSGKGRLGIQQKRKIRCAVLRDEIVVEIDGEQMIAWQGSFRRLSLPDYLQWLPSPRSLFLSVSKSTYEISRLEMSLVGGADSLDPRRLVPTAEQQASVKTALHEELKQSYEQANTPAEKELLLKTLLSRVTLPDDNAAQEYVVWNEARELAATLQDLPKLQKAIAKLADEYHVDLGQLLADSIEELLKTSPPAPVVKNVVLACVQAIDPAIDQRQFATAERLMTLAQTTLRRAPDAQLTKLVTDRSKELKALQPAWEQADAAYPRLVTDPNDAEANLAVGKFLCFGRDAWEAGLPYLAKGSDPDLAALAARSIKPGLPTDELVALADDWWNLSVKRNSTPDKFGIQAGACYWYLFVQPRLTAGTTKTRVDQRLTTLTGPKRPIPPGQARIERAAAEWVLDVGGDVTFMVPGGSAEQRVTRSEDLPSTPFAIVAIDLAGGKYRVGPLGLEKLHALRYIRRLNLSDAMLADTGLTYLKDLTSLTSLTIPRTKSTAAGLVHLQGLVNLQTLNCAENSIRGGWLLLKDCPLTTLHLAYNPLDDETLQQIKTFKGLKKLYLGGGKFTDGLSHLAEFPQLEELSLNGTTVSDALLVHVAKLKSLKKVDLSGAKVTKEGVQKLRAALPGCSVLSSYP